MRWRFKDLLEFSPKSGVILRYLRSVIPERRSPSESVARQQGVDIGHLRAICGKRDRDILNWTSHWFKNPRQVRGSPAYRLGGGIRGSETPIGTGAGGDGATGRSRRERFESCCATAVT
ncbi:hypothetical protein FKM82_005927 [Ascaphus truei]